jgi:hypothetical protein
MTILATLTASSSLETADLATLLQRQAERLRRDAETALAARAHLQTFQARLALADKSLEALQLCTARAYLEMALKHYQSALDALP